MSIVDSDRVSDLQSDSRCQSRQHSDPRIELVKRVYQRLRRYPYYTVIRGIPQPDERQFASQLMLAMASIPSRLDVAEPVMEASETRPARQAVERLSFTRVCIENHANMENGSVTRYSRSSLGLPLHTDSSNKRFPQSLVAFQMVQPDSHGGETLMRPVKDLLHHLSDQTIATLSQPNFPLGRDYLPILWGSPHDPKLRYYMLQMLANHHLEKSFTERQLNALRELEEQLSERSSLSQFKLGRGDLLLLDNTRVLHGRTALSEQSQRLMFRYRIQATALWDPLPTRS